MHTYYSNGKLLLTGEYVVLDGALSLALPTKYGQWLKIEPINTPEIAWSSFDADGTLWFEHTFPLHLKTNGGGEILKRLIQILKAAKTLNPSFLNGNTGFKVSTHLNFNRHWGLGTSSTLINNIAQWAQVNAFQLLRLTFGGSGYDIACAQNNIPIQYKLQENLPKIIPIHFNPVFKDHIYFVYLNKKQNSRDGIATYNSNKTNNVASLISEINTISLKLPNCKSLTAFNKLLSQHELIISNTIKHPTVKASFFPDFHGCIKSLGAWGGDFILVTSKDNPSTYFNNKGYNTIIPYKTMILDTNT